MSMQVDGKYEDWMEVLRLVYYSGESLSQERVGSHILTHIHSHPVIQMCLLARAQPR